MRNRLQQQDIDWFYGGALQDTEQLIHLMTVRFQKKPSYMKNSMVES